MSQREKVYNHTIRSNIARHKYRLYRRIHRREKNKFEDVATLEGTSMPMSAEALTAQNQNGAPGGGQVRVTYDEYMPFGPLPHEVPSDKSGIANGMLPILQTNTVSQPVPYGTKIRTQNHGGKGGPSQGNLKKMRPISVESTADSAFIHASMEGSVASSMASAGWGGASIMAQAAAFLGIEPAKEEPPPPTPDDPVLSIEELQEKYEGVKTKTMPDGEKLEGEYIIEDGRMYFEYSTGMLSDKQRLGVFK